MQWREVLGRPTSLWFKDGIAYLPSSDPRVEQYRAAGYTVQAVDEVPSWYTAGVNSINEARAERAWWSA